MASVKAFFQSLHYQSPPFWLEAFSPLMTFYYLGVAARLIAYRMGWLKTVKVSVPVISIGNLTTGGTGKTPIIQALTQDLLQAGYKVVILSRGYGAVRPQEYSLASSPDYGDEAYQLQQALPEAVVIVGKDRAQNAKRALVEHHPDVILLDDGYQYLKLHRNLNILLIDGDKQFGNRFMLPLGPLREPTSQINRADLVWVTKITHPTQLAQVKLVVNQNGKPGTPVYEVPFLISGLYSPDTHDTHSVAGFLGKRCILFSGIAHPYQFELDARSAGLSVLEHIVFEDHYAYTQQDVQLLLNKRNEYLTALLADPEMGDAEPLLVTTEKDWAKMAGLVPLNLLPSVYIVQVRPVLNDFVEIFRVLGNIQPYAPVQQPVVRAHQPARR